MRKFSCFSNGKTIRMIYAYVHGKDVRDTTLRTSIMMANGESVKDKQRAEVARKK